MIALLLGATEILALSPDQEAVRAFMACLTPVVVENDRRSDDDYLHLEALLADVKRRCANERLPARDALAAFVADRIKVLEGRTPPSGDGWKEDLLDEATIRWMNNATAQATVQSMKSH
jgi:hypothetical protein